MTVATEKQAPASRRNEKVGNVVSTKMQKTIVVRSRCARPIRSTSAL